MTLLPVLATSAFGLLPIGTVLSGPLAAVLAIASLVFIHEFGHFIVAKMCGVGVTIFSLGFGRRIVGFEYKGTDYRISLIPFGGYVRLAGADPFSYDEDPEERLLDPAQAFHRRPVWQRIAVIAAGPAMNLVLPVFVFTALLMAGEPRPSTEVGSVAPEGIAAEVGIRPGDRILHIDDSPELRSFSEVWEALIPLTEGPHRIAVARGDQQLDLRFTLPEGGVRAVGFGADSQRLSTQIGVDDPASPAGRAGLRNGDSLLAVNGVEVRDWLALEAVLATAGDGLQVQVADSDGKKRDLRIQADPAWTSAAPFPDYRASQRFGMLPSSLFVSAVAASVGEPQTGGFLSGCGPQPAVQTPASPAERAGVLAGDRFLRIDGEAVLSWSDVLRLVRRTMEGEGDRATARPIDIEMVRAGQVVSLTMTPEVIEDTDQLARYYFRPVIGVVSMGGYVEGPMVRIRYAMGPALARGSEETLRSARFILDMFGSMATREVAVKDSVGGPVEIFRQAKAAAEMGAFQYARLLAGLSISLGIVNLLPVPVLDGGQLFFFILEALRGRPVSVALRERAQQVGVLMMVLLMLTVLVWDIQRALGS